ncbi:uracil-DNA glycosylase [Notoacmeibacter ruber]|uniref:Uracil-DNA glycosylase-like domain-containing protein n=1 Tax=Notoacmeibacter ruber TaxID=2670375 RepID=A0A3L7J9W9_9HYPH|nr:uracil-DNA glycosylase [Notoacmeibacter ruber]RLQ87547.1 hypothetical protein D8780_04320 [Notoacmeibacter ruber]
MAVMDDLVGILEFYREAGVDTPLDDQPVNRLAIPEPSSDQRPAVASSARSVGDARPAGTSGLATPSAPASSQDLPARIAEATEIARQAETLDALHQALANWSGINLAQAVPHRVFGSGPETSSLLVIGDCPEKDDVTDGPLWSGSAGRMTDRMLAAIGRSRADTRMAAACPWRPPGGLASEEQQALLRPFLLRHIALGKPQVILSFGQTALRTLTGGSNNFLKERGRWHSIEVAADSGSMVPIVVRPTFHPHYLIKNPAQKRLTWQDLLAVKSRLTEKK